MHPLDQIELHIVNHLLSKEAKAQYAAGKVAKRELEPFVEALRRISEHYVHHTVGTRLPSPISSPTDARAYALYYSAINAAKILHLLPKIPRLAPYGANDAAQSRTEPNSISTPHQISVLDLGCGPGTAGLALLSSVEQSVNLTCVESSTPMRSLAEALLTSFSSVGRLASFSTVASIHTLKAGAFDVIIAANVLAEMEEDEARSIIEQLTERLTPRGALLLLEPGQQLHTRRLMRLRNHILSIDTEMIPLFPCLRADACPMLTASETDWCHGSLDFKQPKLNAQLDELLGFNKHRIKYSSFIFQRGGVLLDGVRVLTEPEKTRAGVEALVCSKDTYGLVRVAKRERGVETRAFEKASVFDRLLFSVPCVGETPPGISIREVY
jgi:phospholipid N-methyltransferase